MTKTVKTITIAATLALLALGTISAEPKHKRMEGMTEDNTEKIVVKVTDIDKDSFTYKDLDGNPVIVKVTPDTKFELTTSEDGTYKTYFDEMRDNDTVRLSINSGNVEKVVIDRS